MAEQQISWMALNSGARIAASDGAEIGKVHEVIADKQKDIFSGITFRDGMLGGEHFVPAALIDQITTDEVLLSVDTEEAKKKIEPYEG